MADYSDLMKLEKQAKQSSPSVPSPLPINQTTPQELAGKPANLQAGKPTNMQTSKPESVQARLQANLQAGKPAKPEKYSSYLPGQYKKRLKQTEGIGHRQEGIRNTPRSYRTVFPHTGRKEVIACKPASR